MVATYEYRDRQGVVQYRKVRRADKTFYFAKKGAGPDEWISSKKHNGGNPVMAGVEHLLYRLDEVGRAAEGGAHETVTVSVVEGEKDADRLWSLGLPATTNDGGAAKWTHTFTKQLTDAGVTRVLCFPDNDDPGRTHMDMVARSGLAAGLDVRLVVLPDLPVKGDVSDWLDAGHTLAELQACCTAAAPYVLDDPRPPSPVMTASTPESQEFDLYKKGVHEGEVVANSQHNIRLALSLLGLSFRYNALTNVPIVTWKQQTKPFDDVTLHRVWLQIDEHFYFRPSLDFFHIVVHDLARRDTFHPIKDYFEGLTWDRVPRLDTWLTTYAGATDSAYTRAVGTCVFIAAVRRVYAPGTKFDTVLILESFQGTDKSNALRTLCHDDQWFSDDLPLNVDAKQCIERTAGKWIIEASELQGYSNADADHLKAFLSRQVDGPVRMAYARDALERPRQFVIVATTNLLTEYFLDSTGNRRWWPVRVYAFDLEALRRDRDQLWAEAVFREALKASVELSPDLWPAAAIEQEARRQVDPWEDVLDDAVDFSREAILVSELWDALGERAKYYKKNDGARIARIMQAHRYTRRKKIDSTTVRINAITGREMSRATKRTWAWIQDGTDPSSVEVIVKVTPMTPLDTA